MLIINLAISLFNVLKVNTLECLSIINRECMPRPKILDVNEGIGEALFYLYNVLVNKCSGSCNILNDPISRIYVPNIIRNVNIKVYNFLMRLNETRNVLRHESCKCACLLNSSVCNSKQIWNSDTCRCDCNEDFAVIINCTKGYMWNPSTCACECDMWCKPGQYLDHKNCVCKNTLVERVIGECTSVINETVINNKDNITNDNTTTYIFIGLFSVLLFAGIVCFCVFAYFKWIKGKKLFKNKYTDYLNYCRCSLYIRMVVNSINIINNLPEHRAKIINILDLNSEKLSVMKNNNDKTNVYYDKNPFFGY